MDVLDVLDVCGVNGSGDAGDRRYSVRRVWLPSLARESFTVIDLKLATAEGACSRDRIAWAGIAGSFRLENCEHSHCAVSCPQSNDPSVGLAQRLR